MSNNLAEQSPKSSNCDGVSGIHPISYLIQSLKTSFLDTDYEAVARELMEREEDLKKEKEEIVFGLREKSNILEAEVMNLKLENHRLEADRGRLRRELGLNDVKLKKLETELRLVKDNEEKTCGRLRDNIRELEEEQDKLISYLSSLSDRVDEVNAQFKQVEEEKMKLNACLEELKRENEEVLKRRKEESDACIEVLRKSNDEKDERIKELVKEVKALEREKRDILKDKDEQIEELINEIEDLGVEKRELAVKLGLVEERFLKLEADVISCLCLNLRTDKRFESTHVGKILSGVIKALDSEEVRLTCNIGVINDGNPHKADSFHKESLEAVERKLDISRDGDHGNKKIIFANPIIIDSDDDCENPLYVNSVKRRSDDGSSDVRQTKKLKHEPCKQAKQEACEPSHALLSTSMSDHVLNTCQRQALSLEKCKEKPEPSFADDCKSSNGTPKTPKTDNFWNPRVEELITTVGKRRLDRKLECATDIIYAVDKDDDFCAKAVCALYRLQKSSSSGINGSIFFRNKAFEKCDIERVAALAKFLIDEDPSGKMKKPVSALQEHELGDCRKLAMKYSRQLFDIYKKREDPLFSPMSTDLRYK